MSKINYIHFEAWLLNNEPIISHTQAQVILQQITARDMELGELSRANGKATALLVKSQDKLHRRNTQSADLKNKLLKAQDKVIRQGEKITKLEDKIIGYKEIIEHCNQGCREAGKNI